MRVIITGGTGLIGHPLAERLSDDGYDVVVLSRNPEAHKERFSSTIQLAQWDAHRASGWGHLADGAHCIVNLAGENLAGSGLIPTRWTRKRKERILASRLNAGKAIVEAVKLANTKPEILIQASAVGVYGNQPHKGLTESSPPGTGFLAEVCQDWEDATLPAEKWGVRRAVIRTAVVLDPAGGALARILLPFRLFLGGPMGSGEQWLSWIHPLDALRGIQFLIGNSYAKGPYNLAAPIPVTNEQFTESIGNVLGKPSFFRVPGVLLRTALGEVSSTVLEGQHVLPKALTDLGFEFRFANIEAALENLLRR